MIERDIGCRDRNISATGESDAGMSSGKGRRIVDAIADKQRFCADGPGGFNCGEFVAR
jgi:hypothetical protein